MKRYFTIIAAILFTAILGAQSPQKMSYQAVIRDATNHLVTTQVAMRITILLGPLTPGTNVYVERQITTPNANGLVTIQINGPTVTHDFGTFAGIDWSAGEYHIKTETDISPGDGSNYTIEGTSQILSVPYALHAKTVASYPETDPVFIAHPANGITSTNITNWNSAYSWGNHSGLYRPLGYVPAWSEITSNPFSFVSLANNQLLKYNTTSSKFENWTPNFLTTEVDGSITNEIQTLASVLTTGTDAGDQKIINVNQQGIGTSTPNSSAALEISSNTRGFLPPRMTKVQRDAITPVEGLIVYNTTAKEPNYYDGSAWRNFDGSLSLAIGESYQCGIIAYILQLGDPGYEAGVTHGLIAAPSDLGTGAEWGCMGSAINGAEGTAIGTGLQNTWEINAGCTTAGIAAKLCYDLQVSTCLDWYLPSKSELNKLYINKAIIGGFALNPYWSSTESSINNAWTQNFNSGTTSLSSKNIAYSVRPIRSF